MQRINIIGGGTAGWMCAAYLNKVLGKKVPITLIESANIPTISVGEATFSTAKLFFDYLELEEKDWMPYCNGSYKLAIKFVDWNKEKKHFYHPFQRNEIVDGFHIGEWWLKLKRGNEAYDYSCFNVPSICDHKLSPRYLNGGVYDAKVGEIYNPEIAFKKNMLADLSIQYPYAYHFDASLFAQFLKNLAIENGVDHVVDDVVQVNQYDNGYIKSVLTKSCRELKGDLFIDCTGFKGLLIDQTMKEPYISFSDSLLCDTAFAMQIPRDVENEGMNPYSTATALSSGWAWNIPLYHRDGTGYVFSSSFITNSEAESEFRNHLGKGVENIEGRFIKMKIGRHRNAWVKNCIAIGLSNAFLEPLESSGIFFIQHAIEELVATFPDKGFNDQLRKRFNKSIADCIDGVRDFLILHYCASNREDTPFWKATKEEAYIPQELKDYLQEWKTHLPNPRNINQKYHGFESYSYAVMLQGLGYLPERSLPVLEYMSDSNALNKFKEIKEYSTYLCNTLPSQYEYLSRLGQHEFIGQDY